MDDPSYFSWLQDQPARFQNAAIGDNLARRLRSGELDSQRFYELRLHAKFQPMTMGEMMDFEDQDQPNAKEEKA